MCSSVSMPSPVACTSWGHSDLLGLNKPCPPQSTGRTFPLSPRSLAPSLLSHTTRGGSLYKYSLSLVGSGAEELPLCWGWRWCLRGTARLQGRSDHWAAGFSCGCPGFLTEMAAHGASRAGEGKPKPLVIECNYFHQWQTGGQSPSESHC